MSIALSEPLLTRDRWSVRNSFIRKRDISDGPLRFYQLEFISAPDILDPQDFIDAFVEDSKSFSVLFVFALMTICGPS